MAADGLNRGGKLPQVFLDGNGGMRTMPPLPRNRERGRVSA